jgi:hypothetical protein
VPECSRCVDLGDLKKFASDPNKVYPATRYYREMEKTFRFRMARRTEISRIQLGYRLRLETADVELCRYSRRPAKGFPVIPFPSEPIEKTIHLKLRSPALSALSGKTDVTRTGRYVCY